MIFFVLLVIEKVVSFGVAVTFRVNESVNNIVIFDIGRWFGGNG